MMFWTIAKVSLKSLLANKLRSILAMLGIIIGVWSVICALALAASRRVDPTLTLDQVEQIVDMENFGAVFAACWGVAVPELPPGEAMAVASPST